MVAHPSSGNERQKEKEEEEEEEEGGKKTHKHTSLERAEPGHFIDAAVRKKTAAGDLDVRGWQPQPNRTHWPTRELTTSPQTVALICPAECRLTSDFSIVAK